jgi:hypothetical protein
MSTLGRLKKTLIRSARRAFRREGAGYLEVYVKMRQARKLRVEPERYIILIYRYCWGSRIAVIRYRNACTTPWSILWRGRE